MKQTIRKYRNSDLDEVLSAWESASKLAHPFLNKAFLAQEKINIPNLYLPNADTWVYEHEEKVIGFIALIGNEVGALFVQPKFHGKGIGRALMAKAVELHRQLEVEVFENNQLGRQFYSKYGFTLLSKSIHEATGNNVLRLKYTE